MKGRILIEGVVGEDVTLESVRNQIESLGEFSELQIDINSPGGDVSEGYAIFDYLKDLGVNITTRNIGTVASIATVIFLAGNDKKSLPNAEFMIHNPWIQPNAPMESKDLVKMAEFLERTENKLAQFYSENLEVSKEEIESLMDRETYLDLKEAKKIGFVNAEEIKYKAVAKVKIDNMDKQTGLLKDIKNALDKLVSGAKAEEVKAMEITLADGTAIFVESEDGDFTGKKVYKEEGGEPLEDGTYELEGGRSIVVSEGVIAEVIEGEEEANKEEELEALKAENEALKAELETLTASNEEVSKALEAEKEVNALNGEAISQIMAKIEELEAENKAMAAVTVGGAEAVKPATKTPKAQESNPAADMFKGFLTQKGKL